MSVVATSDGTVERVVRRGTLLRRVRKTLTFVALLFMLLLIGGYLFVTDPNRVRRFAEPFLSNLSGGRVTIGSARLSVFEGLRLDDVRVQSATADPRPIFTAKSLQVSYDPRSLFNGTVAAERVVAIAPRVHLVEDLDQPDAHRWNYQTYARTANGTAAKANGGGHALTLPEVLVRNAKFDYTQIQNGRVSDTGSLLLEGQFTPDPDGHYRFRVQSHGGGDGVFPAAEGTLRPAHDRSPAEVHLVVRDLKLSSEIKTVLPAEVRKFLNDYGLAGSLDAMTLDLFRRPDGRDGFHVHTDLTGVGLTVPPATWMGPGDRSRVSRWHDAYARLAGPTLGRSDMARRIVDSMTPAALRLRDVDASFTFTDERVTIDRLLAHVDDNALLVGGHIDGYSPAAAIDLTIRSLPGRPLVFTESPGFVPAMPWPVQEIYYRFRPVGAAELNLNVSRAAGAEYPKLSGGLDVHDARFTFDKLPYPVERANGRFAFGNDPQTGREALELVSITGHGVRGGVNENARMEVHGTITPLDESAGADIHVRGTGVTGDRGLIDCLPPLTRQAVLNFDADHTGTLPQFGGSFGCDVHRTVGIGQPWLITTKLTLDRGAGKFVGFPYAVHDVTGALTIYDDHLNLDHVHMPAGQGSADLTGVVDWAKHDPATGEPIIQPDLTLRTHAIRIDDALANALPAGKRGLFSRLGLSGLLDIDGRVTASAPMSEQPAVDLNVTLSGGRLKPPDVALTVDDLKASIHVIGDQVRVGAFAGTVAGAAVDGQASADCASADPKVALVADVTALDAAKAPIDALPHDAAVAVRSLHATGGLGLHLRYDNGDYAIALKPADLAIVPDLLPLKFDRFAGSISVRPDGVHLGRVTGRCADAPVSIDGTIDTHTGNAKLVLAARDVNLEPNVIKALPAVLQDVANGLVLRGPVSIDCSKLDVTQPAGANPGRTAFAATLWLQKDTMQIAADVKDVVGKVGLEGGIEGGWLKRLDGTLAVDDMTLAGRRVSRLSAGVHKAAESDVLKLTDLDARLAGGQVGGQLDAVLNRKDPRFAFNLLVRGAKVNDLIADPAHPIDATLDASLALQGRWDDPTRRRGRGDVQVRGPAMVEVPLLFGFMQMANLAVPSAAPIKQAAMRYGIENDVLRMDQIDLRSASSAMQGDGVLDFGKKTMEFNLALADSAADAIPLFGDLIKATRQDLLKLHISGSLQGGTTGRAFDTIGSTVDEVKRER